MIGHEDDILAHLERAIAEDDPDLNGQAPEPQAAPEQAQPAPQQEAAPEPDTMDFAQDAPGTPVDAGAPEGAPAAQPAPTPQTAQQIGQAYDAGNAQAEQQYNQSQALKKQALVDTAGIQQARNDEQAGADQAALGSERHFQLARDAIDAKHMQETQAATAEFDANVEEERALAAKDPHDFWGNSSTVNKIGAIVAMVGAGLAHHDASKAFQQIIDNRVAETQRKRQIYNQIGHDLKYKAYRSDNNYRTELSSVEAKRVAAISDIKNQLKVNMGKYANPQVQANLQASIADLDAQQAEHAHKAISDVTGKRLDIHRARLDEARLAIERDYKNASLGLQADKQAQGGADPDAKNYLPVAGISSYGISRDAHKKFLEDQAVTSTVVSGFDEAQKIFDGVDKLPEKERKLALIAAFSSGDVRNKLGVGANITGAEGSYMNIFLPKFDAFAISGAGYGDIKKTLAEGKKLFIKGHMAKFEAGRHNASEITPQYPLYKQIQEVGQAEEADRQEGEAIHAVEQKDAGNPQKAILDLEAIGTPTAKQRAQQILDSMRKSQGGIFGL